MDNLLALTFWMDGEGGCFAADTCMGWMFPFCSQDHAFYEVVLAPTQFQKVEPKLFFANERTFLHWLHNGVILLSFASGILAFLNDTGEEWAHWYALVLLPLVWHFASMPFTSFCGVPIASKHAFPDNGMTLMDNRIYVSHVDTRQKQKVRE
jgi:hypothetical protein